MRECILVGTIGLDALLERSFVPDLVKIDVDGAELRALQGAPRLLREIRPVIVVEVTRDREEVGRLLSDNGYRMLDPEAGYREVDGPSTNTVAVPGPSP